ncbi:MAG: PQQ-dependent sugar dehydrogenase [Phycisphaeraceae bacterium]|nr:PQQ-dependent sugar dehydrogenase [Phycisphaeraceae bacterium]
MSSLTGCPRLGSLVVALVIAPFTQGQTTNNPLPDSVTPSGLRVELRDYLAAPASSASRPIARLNYLSPAPDGSARLFVNDMRGKLWVIDVSYPQSPQFMPDPVLDLATAPGAALFSLYGEVGFSSFAFHPDFAVAGSAGHGKLYVTYDSSDTSKPVDYPSPGGTDHHSVIEEWTIDPNDPNLADPDTRRQVLRIGQPFSNHNMGLMAFNPNSQPGDADYGKMYIAVADGGSGGDPYNVAQNLQSPLGKILRIDPLSPPGGGANYTAPADNPFVGQDALGEIWALGLRNPHRFSWDSVALGGSGAMFISDIGQSNLEEINLGAAGANYGWDIREGTFATVPGNNGVVSTIPPVDTIPLTYPVAQYDHDEGDAIVGGFVYRGSAIPNLVGKYVFGDLAKGRLFYFELDEMQPDGQTPIHELTLMVNGVPRTLLQVLGNDYRADLRFGLDADGEIYVLTKRDGMIRTLGFIPNPGDFNGDGLINVQDINPFVLAMSNPSAFEAQHPDLPLAYLDLTGDGVIDVQDINPFVQELVAGVGQGVVLIIPEPSGLGGVLLSVCLASRRWRGGVQTAGR